MEEATYDLEFTWTVTSTSANTTLISLIDASMVIIKTKVFFLPSHYLEPLVQYNITCSYQNVLGVSVSDSFYATASNLIPSIKIDGGFIRTVYRAEDNIIHTYAYYSKCLGLHVPLEIEWKQLQGPPLDVKQFYSLASPFYLSFPKCFLNFSTDYEFEITVQVKGYPQFASKDSTLLRVQEDKFYAEINYADRFQPFTKDIILVGKLTRDADCNEDDSSVTYTWMCQRISSLIVSDCDNTTGVYGIETTNNILIIPSTDFLENDVLQVSLIIRKGSQSATKTSKIIISGVNTLTKGSLCSIEFYL